MENTNKHSTEEDIQITNKPTKRYSTSLSSGNRRLKLQWDTTMRLLKLLKYSNTKYWQGCRATGSGIHSRQECKMGKVTLENHLAISYKTKHTTAIPLSNCTPGHLAREMKSCVHTKTCASMFIAALSIIFKNCKQPDVLWWVAGETSCDTSMPWNTARQ